MSFYLKDLPALERPRERLLQSGAGSLSLFELFEIIFSQGSKKNNVFQISNNLLAQYGSLAQMRQATIQELCQIQGIGEAKAAQLHAAIELGRRLFAENNTPKSGAILDTNHASKLALSYLKDKKKEHLLLFCLDSRSRLIVRPQIISVGTLNSSLVHQREVFDCAIRNHAAQIMLAHNHPSGDFTPSFEDFETTKNIALAGNIMGINLLDHIVIGADNFSSIRVANPEIFDVQKTNAIRY